MIERLNIVKNLKTLTVMTAVFALTSLSAFAADIQRSYLSNVEIKNSDNGYQVVLQADKSTAVRKVVNSPDDVTLTVKGLLPSQSIATVYNDVPDIETVMIQPEDDSTKILIKGKNVSSSYVSFAPVSGENTDVATQKTENNKEEGLSQISLNQPIMAYAPVYHRQIEENLQESDGMIKTALALGLDTARCGVPFAKAVVRHILQMNKKVLALCAGFMLIILVGLKMMKTDKEDDMKIGLAQSLKNKEMGMEDQLALRQNSQTLRNQNQQTLQNRNVPSINYGLKAYQNSQRNPYTSQITGLPKRPAATAGRRPIPQQRPQVAPQTTSTSVPKQPVAANRLQSQAKANLAKMASAPSGLNKVQPEPLKTIPGTKSVDSLKFLESMSRIYERSGRADLANELKNNIQNVR